MNSRKFSAKVKKIIKVSREEAIRLGHDYIGTEHFLLGLLHESDSLSVKVLQALDVDIDKLKEEIENTKIEKVEGDMGYNYGNIPLNKHAEKVLKVTSATSKSCLPHFFSSSGRNFELTMAV